MRTLYAILGFLSLITALGLSFDPTPLQLFLVFALMLIFAVFMYKAHAFNITPHAVYFHKWGEAVNFLRKKGYTAKNPYMELTKKKFIIHDGWCVILTTEQEALIHKNDTRLFNHILVNLGLKDE